MISHTPQSASDWLVELSLVTVMGLLRRTLTTTMTRTKRMMMRSKKRHRSSENRTNSSRAVASNELKAH
jgi:hypothetical protein